MSNYDVVLIAIGCFFLGVLLFIVTLTVLKVCEIQKETGRLRRRMQYRAQYDRSVFLDLNHRMIDMKARIDEIERKLNVLIAQGH